MREAEDRKLKSRLGEANVSSGLNRQSQLNYVGNTQTDYSVKYIKNPHLTHTMLVLLGHLIKIQEAHNINST